MDTYFDTNFNCVKCGRCVRACAEEGQQFLEGGRDVGPETYSFDYVPCHHCPGVWKGEAPCQKVCYYDAIEIERW